VEQAKAHLLQAGSTSGGVTLTSFGPNMSLAKELADRGERDTVITYRELFRKFWQNPKLNAWIKTLKDGKVPSFGANLVYRAARRRPISACSRCRLAHWKVQSGRRG
jgi:hypothetical protein